MAAPTRRSRTWLMRRQPRPAEDRRVELEAATIAAVAVTWGETGASSRDAAAPPEKMATSGPDGSAVAAPSARTSTPAPRRLSRADASSGSRQPGTHAWWAVRGLPCRPGR
jgi:hypothetical protein